MSELTKKHFEAIADVMRRSRPDPWTGGDGYDTWVGVVQRMTHYLRGTNPLFNCKKFWEACGLV